MFKFNDEKGNLKCSFCGKPQEQVRKLVAGPGVYICDECIELCSEIVVEELGIEEEIEFKKASNDELRAKFLDVMPDYDQDAVYPSDMRKVFAWYQMLMDKNLLDFTEEEKPAEEAAPKEKAE